ncbi:MAG: hypothetical protein JSW11_01860, partial [Candidatus Heimdallarchaeota archaeon]
IYSGNEYQWFGRRIDESMIPSDGTYYLYAEDVSSVFPGVYIDKIMITKESEILIDELSDGSKSKTIMSGDYDANGNHDENLKIHKDAVISSANLKLEGKSAEVRMTLDAEMHRYPRIWGNRIVWQEEDGGDLNIYMYDLSTDSDSDNIPNFLEASRPDPDPAKIEITLETDEQVNPAIYENIIVWEDYRNGHWDIYMYDISTSTETQITTNMADQINPAIWGDKIVWQDYRNGDSDIYLYDLTVDSDDNGVPNYLETSRPNPDPAEVLITIDPEVKSDASQINPKIYEKRIVWRDNKNDLDGDEITEWDIYMRDLAFSAEVFEESEQRITLESSQYCNHPNIYGDKIVYSNNNYIILYNIGETVD